jgi:hypothetical protein
MKIFLRRFVLAVSGVLSGFDRVFKGRLPQLYSPEGMNCYASANGVLYKNFSSLNHHGRHPRFGWMYVRLQTWFPFEIQIGINGREWLAQRMDREGMRYRASRRGME